MKLIKRLVLVSALLTMIFAVAACEYETDEITLGEGDWESNEFHNQITRFIIEYGYGIDVNIDTVDTALLVQGLREGTIHVNMEMWGDNIPTFQDDLDQGYYEIVSVNFDDNYQGLYIPQYLAEQHEGLRTIQDLPEYKHLFPDPEVSNWDPEVHQAVVHGGPSGWAVTNFLQTKFENEDLYPGLVEHFVFRPSESTTLLNTTMLSAYEDEEPWVGYNWEPTWILGQLDMLLLEDEYEYDADTGAGNPPTQDVTVVVTADFESDYPEIHAFLSNYETSSAITADGLAYMQTEDASTEEAARWWLREYEDLWSNWVTEDAHTAIMDALDTYDD